MVIKFDIMYLSAKADNKYFYFLDPLHMTNTNKTTSAETSYIRNVITKEERVDYIVDVLQTNHILEGDAKGCIRELSAKGKLRINPKADEIEEALNKYYKRLTKNEQKYVVALLNKQFAQLESEGLSATASIVYTMMKKIENYS